MSPRIPLHHQIGDFAPKFVELSDDVVFGDIWRRPELSRRDRSLVIGAALVALNRTPHLEAHLELALRNGLTVEELVEAITHLSIYAGFPCAASALTSLKAIVEQGGAEPQEPSAT